MAQPKAKTMIERAGFRDPDSATPQHDAIVKWIESNIGDVLQSIFPVVPWPRELVAKLREEASETIGRFKAGLEREEKRLKKEFEAKYDPQKDAVVQDALRIFGGVVTDVKTVEQCELLREIESLEGWCLGNPPEVPAPAVIRGKWEHPVMSRNIVAGFIDYLVEATLPVLSVGGERDQLKWVINPSPVKVYFEAKTKIPSIGELIRQINFYQSYEPGVYVVVSPDDSAEGTLRGQGIGFVKCPELLSNGQRNLFS